MRRKASQKSPWGQEQNVTDQPMTFEKAMDHLSRLFGAPPAAVFQAAEADRRGPNREPLNKQGGNPYHDEHGRFSSGGGGGGDEAGPRSAGKGWTVDRNRDGSVTYQHAGGPRPQPSHPVVVTHRVDEAGNHTVMTTHLPHTTTGTGGRQFQQKIEHEPAKRFTDEHRAGFHLTRDHGIGKPLNPMSPSQMARRLADAEPE